MHDRIPNLKFKYLKALIPMKHFDKTNKIELFTQLMIMQVNMTLSIHP